MVFSSLFKTVAIVYLSFFVNLCDSLLFIEGYYWRDFYGFVPNDAFPGGEDRNGYPIYVGQIIHDNKIITTKIYWNDTKGYYALDGTEHFGTAYIKILCTHNVDNFIWIQTNHDKIHLLTKHEVVLGGYEPGYILYIGRVLYNSEKTVGRISTGKLETLGLYITDSSGKEHVIKSFEILTYNSSHSKLINPTTTCEVTTIPV